MDRYDTLLISSSSQENRQLLRGILEARFNLLEDRCQRLLQVFETLFSEKIDLSCSIGVALSPEHGSPCEDCPSRNIRQDKNASGIVKVERTDTSLLAEAALIQWEGRDACMMICR